MTDALTERDLKAFCLSKLLASRRINSNSVIASEFPLADSSGRIDLAILTPTNFTGVEIKSERDSLRRLDKQIEAFSRYFDRLIVILAGKHGATLLELPDNVELWKLTDRGLLRTPSNSIKRQSETLFSLLPKRKRLTLKGPTAESATSARIEFFQEFRRRYQDTSTEFWKKVEQDGLINTHDLAFLSPHRAFRAANEAHLERKLQILKAWHSDQSDQSSSVS